MKIRGNTVGTPIKPERVLCGPLSLTEEEKAQARANIDAAKVGEGGGGGSSVEIDTTLSIEGAAADAAAVGAKLGDIETALDDIIAIQNALIGGDS